MSDLISRSALIEFVKEELKQDRPYDFKIKNIQRFIEDMPTAYNVDAVVAELGNIKVKHSYNPIKDEIMYKGIDLEEVTSIVRKGGVE